jgi:hypothetical protein
MSQYIEPVDASILKKIGINVAALVAIAAVLIVVAALVT